MSLQLYQVKAPLEVIYQKESQTYVLMWIYAHVKKIKCIIEFEKLSVKNKL
jgi:hypothetical protein